MNKSIISFQKSLEKYLLKLSDRKHQDLLKTANFIKQETIAREPIDTGYLESQTRVVDVSKDKVLVIVEAPYVKFTHEGVYNLGIESQLKQKSSKVKVGRRYMSRAISENIKTIRSMLRGKT